MAFDVIDVSGWFPDTDEELGARTKMWLSRSADSFVPEALWKEGRPGEKVAETGADLWAERIAAEIAPLMGIPAARVDLAVWTVRGVLSWRLDGNLKHGNELLSDLHESYEADSKGAVAGYDLESIRTALRPYRGWTPGLSAFDCFSGLLVFDALIGNTDRHHENWAVVEESASLAPSYDHGASLGFNASRRMRQRPTDFAAKGISRHFPGQPTLLQLAVESIEMAAGRATDRWRDSVAVVDTGVVEGIVASVPAAWMSDPMRTFVVELVTDNRRRLLECLRS